VAAPIASILKLALNSHKHRATFTLAATGALTGYQCALVKVPSGKHRRTPAPSYGSCSTPQIYKHLKAGKYVFYVRAVGPGGTQAPAVPDRFKIG